jgi:poly-beta-1,6-N-acetyl-D-glucosamine synthase
VVTLTFFWVSCGLLIYTYALYPVLVVGLAKCFGSPVVRDNILRPVTIIVTAYNEADCIRAKLDNLALLDYPRELMQAMVVSNGSSDGTDDGSICARRQNGGMDTYSMNVAL